MDIYEVLEKYAEEKTNLKKAAGGKETYDYSNARQKEAYNTHVALWKTYYEGNVEGIHTDRGFNGNNSYEFKRKSMKLPKLIAQKWATMLFTEQFKITLKNDAETAKFRELERRIGFRPKLIEAVTWGYAEGTSALLASADLIQDSEGKITGGKVKLDILKYGNIYPVVFTKDAVSVMAFVKQEGRGKKTVYTISIHSEENGRHTVENFTASQGSTNKDIVFSAKETVITANDYINPAYCLIKPNTVNDCTDTLPFGQSIFADSLSACDDADLAAAGLRRDVKEGDQVTFIGRDLLIERDNNGEKTKRIFDNSAGRFFTIPQGLGLNDGNVKERLYDKVVPEIRAEQYRRVFADSLNWACMTSGLGKNTLDVMPQHTATEIVHTEAEKMQNKSLHEQYLEGEIIKTVKSMCELSEKIGNPIDASEVNIVWEDSVIVDTSEQKKLAMLEVDAGLMTKEEYRTKFYAETVEAAKKKIAEIAGETDEKKTELERNKRPPFFGDLPYEQE
jgi:A118 family predicted phage portal protein